MPDFKITGVEELKRKLEKLPQAAQGRALRAAGTLATTPIVQTARTLIPVNDRDYLKKTFRGRRVAPGFAKRNIAKKTVLYQNGRFVKAMVGVRPEAFYATQFVERGTSRQKPQPWLEPAYRRNRANVLRRFGRFLEKKIMAQAKRK